MLIAAAAGFYFYSKNFKNQGADAGKEVETGEESAPGNQDKIVGALPGEKKGSIDLLAQYAAGDADGDKINDIDESRLGTDKNKADTDEDGLSDFKESRVYKTDPLKKDTDADGYVDGDEVKSGRNPLGDGAMPVAEIFGVKIEEQNK